jgi:divalent metal cation (Fe/Co/Zn/Cd) transporter
VLDRDTAAGYFSYPELEENDEDLARHRGWLGKVDARDVLGAATQVTTAQLPGGRERAALLRRGFALEYLTLGWNVAGIAVLAVTAIAARSVALAGFGLDSLIEIGASTVVIWELSGTGQDRQRRGLRLIGYAFTTLALYLLVQSTLVLAAGYRPRHSVAGIIWTAVTAAVMFALAAGKARTGRALDNPVLRTEGRVTMIDGILATAVLAGLVLNAAAGWWWADPAAGYVLVGYAAREVREIFSAGH